MQKSFSLMLMNRTFGLLLLLMSISLAFALFSHEPGMPSFSNASTETSLHLFQKFGNYISGFMLWVFDLLTIPLLVLLGIWGVWMMILGFLPRWRLKLVFLLVFIIAAPLGVTDASGLWGKIINKEIFSLLSPDWHQWIALASMVVAGISYLLALTGLRSWVWGVVTLARSIKSVYSELVKRRRQHTVAQKEVADEERDVEDHVPTTDNFPTIRRPKKTPPKTKLKEIAKEKLRSLGVKNRYLSLI